MALNKLLENNPQGLQYSADANNPPIGTVTSSFFVAMDDLFATSNVGAGASAGAGDLANAVHLLYFSSVEERPSIGTMTSDFQASATLVHSLLEMHIMTDSAMPTLRQAMRNNKAIEKIIITRVGHLGEGKDNSIMYTTTFGKCFLESIEEMPDKMIIKARVTIRTDKANATDFTATAGGNTVSGWDYSQNAPAS